MDVKLTQGRIIVNYIHHVINSENFHVFEVDLKSKYPGPVDWEYDYSDLIQDHGYSIRVYIDVNPERTVKTDPLSLELTSILFPFDKDGWSAMSEASRYTWRIVLWKRPVDES